MDALRTEPRTPSPVAAAALERLAAIITQRGRTTPATDLGRSEAEQPQTGTQAESLVDGGSDGASRAWPGGVHARDAHRPHPQAWEPASPARHGLPDVTPGSPGEQPLVSPDMLVMAHRGVHEFIGLIDDTRELQRLVRLQTEGTDGTGGDVGRDAGCRGGGDIGDRDAATGITPGNDGATGRGLAGGVPTVASTDWSPPLSFATWLAWRTIISLSPPLLDDAPLSQSPTGARRRTQTQRGVVWVGQDVWPGVSLLHRCPGLMHASLLVDCDRPGAMAETSRPGRAASRRGGRRGRSRTPAASGLELRVWAAEQAIRSGACSLVVADGSGFSRVMTQRLQLAAESGHCSCVLLRRPGEVRCLSAASTRWLVHREATGESSRLSESPLRHAATDANVLASAEVWSTGWIARLWKCKGATPISMPMTHERAWLLRMVYRADDLSRFNDFSRNARDLARGGERTRRARQHRVDAGRPTSGFDLVPVLVHRSAAASDATSPRDRRAAG